MVESKALNAVGLAGPRTELAKPSDSGTSSGRRAEWLLWCLLGGYACLIWSWNPAYLTLTVDDSFYYWEVANRLAEGQGPTFDGVEPTDGYHPLWLGVVAGLQWLTGWHVPNAMRAVLTLQLGLVGAAVVALGRNKEFPLPGVCAVVAWVLSAFYALKVVVNGQESALQWLLLVAGLLAFWRAHRSKGSALLAGLMAGVLFGLCALSRLESLLFGLAASAYWLVLGRGVEPRRSRRLGWWCLAGLGSVFLPYFLYHLAQTGHFQPVSGAIKASRAATLSPATRLVACAALIGSFVACRRVPKLFHALFPLLVYALGLAVYLIGVRGVGFAGIWYLPPYLLVACAAIAYALARCVPAPGRLRTWVVASWLVFAALQWGYRLLPSSANRYTEAANVGTSLDRMLPATARVGSWDAGIVGAHAQLPVSNLDGLVNSWSYHDDYLVPEKTSVYLSEHGIDYIAQYFRQHWWEDSSLVYRGVDFTSWRVLRARCYPQRAVGSFWRSSNQAFLILSRRGPGMTLQDWRGEAVGRCLLGSNSGGEGL